MKLRYKSIIGLFLLPFISFCSQNNLNDSSIETSSAVVEITKGSFMQDCNILDAIGDFGKYGLFTEEADATIGISSSRYYPLGEERIMAFYDPTERVSTKAEDNHAYNIKINDKNVFAPFTRSSHGSIKEMFGGKVRFDLSAFGSSTKSGGANITELYAPQIVRIEFPRVTVEEDLNPLCYYKNYIVRWNKDEDNANGIIIIVKWNGIMAFGEDYPSSYIQRLVCVPDTGEAELEELMFDEIPDAAYCSLYVLRGDVDNVNIDDETYRLLAETHDVVNFILVRNIVENE